MVFWLCLNDMCWHCVSLVRLPAADLRSQVSLRDAPGYPAGLWVAYPMLKSQHLLSLNNVPWVPQLISQSGLPCPKPELRTSAFQAAVRMRRESIIFPSPEPSFLDHGAGDPCALSLNPPEEIGTVMVPLLLMGKWDSLPGQ